EISIHKIELKVKSILESTAASYDLLAKNKNITIKIDADEQTSILGDKFIIETVIGNLLDNAIKFSPDNSEIVLSERKEDNFIEISVADRGRGMDEITLNSIFYQNHHISTSGTNNERGTGLGLKICKEFIDLHCGTIEVESELSKGSKFKVKFPVA
ncbi:MAG: HAMP domain-containing histidine kinase, partial [Bacteroidetes bacterium]|nr:HAMP domain-containing histidine kinase [Bacteroidota bacterium]